MFTNKLTKEHKLLLALDALLLSEAIGYAVNLGKIVHGDSRATLKVKTPGLVSEARKRIKDIAALLARNTPPDLVLNRHCGQCEFQARCRRQAMEKDGLSLLSGMSEKERKKLHAKGIFTVTQLSYTFRPRRRRRKSRGKQQKHYHSLRALAIREKKIHAVGIPDPKLDGTPVYLDVEGLPDHDFYYLIGVRIGTGEDAVQHGL
jgi:predicted RecB family nuclease